MSNITDEKIEGVKSYLLNLQSNIISMICKYEDHEFYKDKWSREEGGGGITCILQGGETFDKVGVNFSDIAGESLPSAATNLRPELTGRKISGYGCICCMSPKESSYAYHTLKCKIIYSIFR